ncbi:MAG TPA: CHASE domain-containing protein [Phycisphaerae bacterium]
MAIFGMIRGWERAAIREEVHRLGQERAELLNAKILQSSEVVFAIRSFFAVHHSPTRSEFRAFVAPALARQPELSALEWVPRVSHDQRSRFEQQAIADGVENFQFTQQQEGNHLTRAPDRAEYFPVYYLEPLQANLRAAGYDISTSDIRRATLEEACDEAQLKATSPITLAQETGTDPYGFLVVLPIYANGEAPATVAERRAALTGFALAVFRISDLIDQSLSPLASSGINVSLKGSAGTEVIYQRDADPHAATSQWAAPLHAPFSRTGQIIPLYVGGRTWNLELSTTSAFVAGRYSWEPWGALFSILLLTAGLGAYLLYSARHAEIIESHVAKRTVQLLQEIHERRRIEAAAKTAEEHYRSIFENAIEGIFQTTADGRYLTVNTALARMYGFDTPESLIRGLGDIAHELYVDPRRRDDFILAIRRDSAVWDFESQIRRRDGAILWISENARAVHNSAGELLYYEGTVVDITRRKAAEESLQLAHEELEMRVGLRTVELAHANGVMHKEIAIRKQAEESAERATRAKSAFLATMTHELRTPMNAILGYSQLMSRDSNLTPTQRRAVSTIQTAGTHLMGVISEVLDLSKIESGKMVLSKDEFDLVALAHGIVAMFDQRAKQKNVHLLLCMEKGPLTVKGDESKLRQVLINLIGNALKFTDSGQVAIHIRREAGDIFRFEVSDTGPGIAPEHHELIFQPFCQSDAGLSRGGTGLGLAIAQEFVQLMAQSREVIRVKSERGCGASFYFILPLELVVPSPAGIEQFHSLNAENNSAWDGLVVPARMLAHMSAAAETCSTTELKRLLAEMDSDTPQLLAFVRTLQNCIDTFDFAGVQALVRSAETAASLAEEKCHG